MLGSVSSPPIPTRAHRVVVLALMAGLALVLLGFGLLVMPGGAASAAGLIAVVVAAAGGGVAMSWRRYRRR